jgi:hypothetical protein
VKIVLDLADPRSDSLVMCSSHWQLVSRCGDKLLRLQRSLSNTNRAVKLRNIILAGNAARMGQDKCLKFTWRI